MSTDWGTPGTFPPKQARGASLVGWNPYRIVLFVTAMAVLGFGVFDVVALAHAKSSAFVGGVIGALGAWTAYRVLCRVRGRPASRKWEERRPGPLG